MLFHATVKWPGHDGELYLEARDGLDLANQLRRLNKEFGPGSDINFTTNNEGLVYQYFNTTTSVAAKSDIDERTIRSRPVTRDFLTDAQGKWYIPQHIQFLKRLLIDDITLSVNDKWFLDSYNAKLDRQAAGRKIIPTAERNQAAINKAYPGPTPEETQRYDALSSDTKKAYRLKRWRDKEGHTTAADAVIPLSENIDWTHLLSNKIDVLESGPAGYQRLLQVYRNYRDNANEDVIPQGLDEVGKNTWLLKRKGQPVIRIYGPMSGEEFNKHFQPYAKARQSSVTKAFRSVADSFFTWKNLLNPFFWVTLGISALGIQALLAVFSPTALVAAAPVLIKLSLIGGALGALVLVPYALWAVVTDVASKTDNIHRRMGFNLKAEDIEIRLAGARENYEYYLNFARCYVEGLQNRFNAWKENHKYQFVGVSAGVAAFVLLTLFTSLCLGQVPGFEFMQPVLDFLTSMITSSLAGITSVGSAAAPMALFIAATFLMVGPLAFAHFARTFGQTAHEAQYAAHRLDQDSEHKQDQKRALFAEQGQKLASLPPLFKIDPPKKASGESADDSDELTLRGPSVHNNPNARK